MGNVCSNGNYMNPTEYFFSTHTFGILRGRRNVGEDSFRFKWWKNLKLKFLLPRQIENYGIAVNVSKVTAHKPNPYSSKTPQFTRIIPKLFHLFSLLLIPFCCSFSWRTVVCLSQKFMQVFILIYTNFKHYGKQFFPCIHRIETKKKICTN